MSHFCTPKERSARHLLFNKYSFDPFTLPLVSVYDSDSDSDDGGM